MTQFKDDLQPKMQIQGTVCGNIPVLLKIFIGQYDPEGLAVELLSLSKDKSTFSSFRGCLMGDEFRQLKFVSNDDEPVEVSINGINGYNLQESRARLNIEEYEYGISESPLEHAEHIYVLVELTPSGILGKWGIRELDPKGNIKQDEAYPEEATWRLPIGEGKAFSRYTYESHVVYDNKATLQIERPALHFDIKTPTNLSTKELREKIENEARDICLILSLCYRKVIRWYEMKFTVIRERNSSNQVSPVVRRKTYRELYPDNVEELISHRTLINGGLSDLLTTFRESPMMDALRRCITFLASSKANHTIEIKYFLTIISLESFCDGFIEHTSSPMRIPSGKWGKIEKALRDSLNALSGAEDLLPFIDGVKRKLPELKRITTFDQIFKCCKELDIRLDGLWERDGFENGLNKALDARNQLFHRAFLDDAYFLYANQLKLQTLIERLVLKHLKWPEDKIWPWQDQELRLAIMNE